MTDLDWFIAMIWLLAAMWCLRGPIKYCGEMLQSVHPSALTAVKVAKAAAEVELLLAQAPARDPWHLDGCEITVSAVKLAHALRVNGIHWSDENPPVVLLSLDQWIQFTTAMMGNRSLWPDALAASKNTPPVDENMRHRVSPCAAIGFVRP